MAHRPSNLISIPLVLYPPATPTFFVALKHYAKYIPTSGSLHLLFSPLGPLLPSSPHSCLSLNVTLSEGPSLKLPQQVSTHLGAHSNSQSSIYFLQITDHHLKNIICCMYIVCLPNLTQPLEYYLPEGRERLICSPLGSQHLEPWPALSRGSINTYCLNCYHLQATSILILKYKLDHVTPLLRIIPWLPTGFRIQMQMMWPDEDGS